MVIYFMLDFKTDICVYNKYCMCIKLDLDLVGVGNQIILNINNKNYKTQKILDLGRYLN